ncbi:hypothetical protein ABL78_3628 [Leptomonas seymouri]|uniref:Uncharacterized protein n=1 Tax=Leptomonas seymouri TaxID=5684 RepID=A0A0N1PEK5_LEPSE|nr:hypothetical protein ABL78_3628 [Leptomonas seymouri]|eukprot:KPI87291.1 hypothetical protein ABL78_3628 [Leptomonas seymouri]
MPPKGTGRVKAGKGMHAKPPAQATLQRESTHHEAPPPFASSHDTKGAQEVTKSQKRRGRPRLLTLSFLHDLQDAPPPPLLAPPLLAGAVEESGLLTAMGLPALGPPQPAWKEVAEQQAELTVASSPTPNPPPSVFTSAVTISPPSASSVSVGAASMEGEAGTPPTSHEVVSPSDLCPAPLSTVGCPRNDSYSSGPPSMLSCLAACFGWQLASYSFSEGDEVQFSLRRHSNSSVRATVKASCGVFDQLQKSDNTAPASHVYVNGTAVSLDKCAALLYHMTERIAPDRELDTQPQQLITPSLPSPESFSLSTDSPTVQPSPVLTQVGRTLAAPRGAEKRARCRSPSPPSPPPMSPHPRSASGSLSRNKAQRENDEGYAAPPWQNEGSLNDVAPIDATRRENENERVPKRERKAPQHVDEASPPSSLPPSPSSRIGMAASMKVELAHSPVSVAPPRQQQDQHPQRKGGADDGPLAFLLLQTAGAASPPPRPPPQRPASTKRSLANSALVATTEGSPGKGTMPPSRSRRANVGTLTGPSGTTASGDATTVGREYSPPSAHSASLHGSAKLSFFMPYMLAPAYAPAGTAFVSGGGGDGAPTTEKHEDSSRGTPGQLKAFSGLDGWSAESSLRWLAHTHAVSREFELLTDSHTLHTSTEDSAFCGDDNEADEREMKESKSNGAAADVAAAVRATLQQRWRQRSLLWSQMEESLRLSVGSGRLRGDALEAGVQALQAGEEEQLRYGGVGRGEDGGLGGYEHLVTTGREAALHAFPSIPPRPLLPVSGKTVVEAQHRISAAEEAEAKTGEDGNARGYPPRYAVYPDGIPAADRIVIDRTYTTRGSYVVAPTPSFLLPGGGYVVKNEEEHEEMEGRTAANLAHMQSPLPSSLPALLVNPQEDLHYHIYKRFLTKGMREALEAEGTLVIGPDGIGPVRSTNTEGTHARVSSKPGVNRDDDDNDDGETQENNKEEKRTASCVPAVRAEASTINAAGDAEQPGSADIDYILRYRPAIQRIPMPDVESQYGL